MFSSRKPSQEWTYGGITDTILQIIPQVGLHRLTDLEMINLQFDFLKETDLSCLCFQFFMLHNLPCGLQLKF